MKAAVILLPKQIETRGMPNRSLLRVNCSYGSWPAASAGRMCISSRGNTWAATRSSPGMSLPGWSRRSAVGVTRFKPGDRVAVEPNLPCDNCINCLNNRQNFCLNWQAVGVTRPGGMAQYVSVPEKAAFRYRGPAFRTRPHSWSRCRACCMAWNGSTWEWLPRSPSWAPGRSVCCSCRACACRVPPR